MAKYEDFKLLKIQTCALKVNIHCDGCKQKVKKLLQRTEGVYRVNIDADQQKVTVSGSIDSATLIKKLGKAAGKHAEIWSQQSKNQVQKQTNNICLKGGKNNSINKGLAVFGDDDDYFDDDDDDENGEDEENELRFLRPTQLGLLRQQMEANSNAKNNINKMSSIVHNKGNPIQNLGLKPSPDGGTDQKAISSLRFGDQVNLNHPTGVASIMMQNQLQPQLMYQRSSFIAPNTAYYTDQMPNFSGDSSALVFSDEDDSSCSIM